MGRFFWEIDTVYRLLNIKGDCGEAGILKPDCIHSTKCYPCYGSVTKIPYVKTFPFIILVGPEGC